MNRLAIVFTILIMNISFLTFAQEVNLKKLEDTKPRSIKLPNESQATGDYVRIKDDDGNTLLKVIDEGIFGSLELQNGVPATTTNKLYNNSGILNFNGTALGSGGVSAINDLSDGIFDGSSLFLGKGSGINDDGTSNKNTAIGYRSLNQNITGSYNIANGNMALYLNTNGNYNSANGCYALYNNETGNSNTANGYATLYNNTSGSYNTANGYNALISNTTGEENTATGSYCLRDNTTGLWNIAVGYAALMSNKTGNANTANGYQALYLNTTGYSNTAIGYQALYSNIDATGNTATGSQALYSNNYGQNNTATGFQTLFSNTDGWWNAANGRDALYSNRDGNNNTANGFRALYYNYDGDANVANGSQALYNNIDGSRNSANGAYALHSNSSGYNNTATGYNALYHNTLGNSNTAHGRSALHYNYTGSNNTAVGYDAGSYYLSTSLSNTTALGYDATTTTNNQVRIGNSFVTSIGGYQNWTNISDIRYKQDIQEDVVGIDFIMGLKPITYYLDVEAIASKLGEGFTTDEDGNRVKVSLSQEMIASRQEKLSIRNSGFVAQEVEELATRLGYEFSGVEVPQNEESFYGLRYAEFVVPIVKAIQEQQALILELRAEIDELKNR